MNLKQPSSYLIQTNWNQLALHSHDDVLKLMFVMTLTFPAVMLRLKQMFAKGHLFVIMWDQLRNTFGTNILKWGGWVGCANNA